MAYISFEELAKDRSDWYKLSKKIGFIEGIERLLTQLYPDKAHFIYELLQNAEDAKATRVEFHLEKDSLVFIHDGKRLFNLRDVESITSIADSTKREDGTSIGKFGIGFKAVFAYTDTPTIHSGEWNFQISHMVVPERCSADPSYRDQTAKTIFRFPFDKARKPADKAYSEVLEGLSLLEPESILFLQNISEVYVSYAGKEQFITKSKRQSLIELVKLTGEGQSTSCHYLQFSKTVSELTLEDGTTVDSLPVGVAYRLKERSGARAGVGLKLSDRFDVVPVDRRNVFVFFPADKETSGLRFCVHGPFASTAARDSICDTVDNRKLMEIVSNLQVESLTMLKEDGFISTDFLEVLPNSRDNIGGMYECFHRNLVSVFKTQPFTPKKYGGYAPADELRRGPAALSDIFDDADLSDLTWSLDVAWAKNANRQNSPADVFLSDLDIGEWGTDDLIRVLSCFSDGWKEEEQEEAIVRLLEKKTNVQLTALYALLEDYLSGRHYYDDPTSDLRKALLFRLSDGTFACASEGLVSGIPIENASGDVTVRYIHPAITGEECPPKNKERVDRFLKRMGIEPFSEAVMMRLFVSQFWSAKEKVLTTEQSVRNLKAMLRLVQSGEVSHEVAQQLPVLNSDERIVRLNTTFLDDPYVSTGLSAYAEPLRSVGVTRLSPSYAELLGGKLKKEFVEKCAAFGVRQELWLVDSPYYMNPRSSELHDFSRRSSSYERGSDYDIPGIAKFVSSPTVEQAKLIWEFVLARPAEYLIAEYHANASDPGRRVPAKYIYTLTHAAWIPVGGIRKKPSELSLQDIPGDWRRPKDGYEHRALKAMNFGQETEKRRAEQEQRVELLKKSGFDSAEEVADLQNIKKWCQENGMTVKQFLSRISGEKKPGSTTTRPPKPLPKRSASNVNQRMSTASSRFEKAAEQTYVVVGRSVHVGNSHTRDAARTYLRSEYEGDGEMFCQLCHNTMPFRGRDGLGYFEATQVFLRMKKDVAEQFISLCPTCRAKYDEWVRRSQDRSRAFKEAILKHLPQQGEDGVMIPLPGAEENGVKSPLSGKSVYFTGTHFVDLRQAVLENEKLGGLDEFTGVEMATASSPTKKSFLDWYVQYDSEGAALLQKAGDAFARLEVCRREKKKMGEIMWSTSYREYLKKIMSFWSDYHSQFPFGESQSDASMAVERRCKNGR